MHRSTQTRRLLAGPILVMLTAMPALAGPADIPVTMHVVFCAPDLLHCRDVDTIRARFDSMDVCQVDLDAFEAARPADGARVFARCRHLPDAEDAQAAPPVLP